MTLVTYVYGGMGGREIAIDSPHYVYRLYDEAGRLIYVGCTVDPKGRVATHRRSAWWGHQIHTVRNIVFQNRYHAHDMERKAIAEENPRWNVKGRWASRSLWLAQDYADYYLACTSSPSGSAQRRIHLEKVALEAERRYGILLPTQGATA